MRLFCDLSGDPGHRGGERKEPFSLRDVVVSLTKQAAFQREQRAQHTGKEAFHREVGALFPPDVALQSASPAFSRSLTGTLQVTTKRLPVSHLGGRHKMVAMHADFGGPGMTEVPGG
jgi:hypothetical protein